MAQNTFPPPPVYFSLYTDEARDDPSHPDHRFFTPPPPITQPFVKFGKWFTGKRTEYVLGEIPRLYDGPSDDKAGFDERINYSKELRRLNKMLVEQYVNLLQVIASPMLPMQQFQPLLPFDPSLRGLSAVLDNITHLLNSLRQHQARQAVIALLQSQVTSVNNKAQELEDLSRATRTLLESSNFDTVAPYTEPSRPLGGYMARKETHKDEAGAEQSNVAIEGGHMDDGQSNSINEVNEWDNGEAGFSIHPSTGQDEWENGASTIEGENEWDE